MSRLLKRSVLMRQFLHTQQVIVKSREHQTYLEEVMKSSHTEFSANTSLLSQGLCRKHYISLYLGENPAKF